MSQSTDAPKTGRRLEVVATPQVGYGGGFRTPWIEGQSKTGEPCEFTLDSGAGTGNPYLTLTVHFPQRHLTVTENIDATELLKVWLSSICEQNIGLKEVHNDERL